MHPDAGPSFPTFTLLLPVQLSLLPAAGREMSTGQSALMLCGCEVEAGWLILFVDKRVGGRYICVIPC